MSFAIQIVAWSILGLGAIVLVPFILASAKNVHNHLTLGNQRYVKNWLDISRVVAWMGLLFTGIWIYVGLHGHDGNQKLTLWTSGLVMVIVVWVVSVRYLHKAIVVHDKQEKQAAEAPPLGSR